MPALHGVTNDGFTPETGLTAMHRRIHCAATPDADGVANELDSVSIENFLDTIAEIAMAIARYKELKES